MFLKLPIEKLFLNSSRRFSKAFCADELILYRVLRKDKKGTINTTSKKVVTLKEKGIIKTKFLEIFHEHIIGRTDEECTFKIFDDDKTLVKVKRPSIDEYMNGMSALAISSQFSVLSLVPFLLEIDKNSKILESGTGNGCMTLNLSKHLQGTTGEIHTFDVTEQKVMNAQANFTTWVNSYNRTNSDKWPNNAKFFVGNITDYRFDEKYNEYYDAIYLDFCNLQSALKNVTELLRPNGVIIVNCMQLLQIVDCLNMIAKHKLNLKNEIILEPSNRLWDIQKPLYPRNDDYSLHRDSSLDLVYKCRLQNAEKENGGGLTNNWAGFLMKLRKVVA
jgi:tRNA A58 N-methylase Trm61